MSVLAEFSIVPLGKGVSVSAYVARVLQIVAESGVSYKANPMGTVHRRRVGNGHVRDPGNAMKRSCGIPSGC